MSAVLEAEVILEDHITVQQGLAPWLHTRHHLQLYLHIPDLRPGGQGRCTLRPHEGADCYEVVLCVCRLS